MCSCGTNRAPGKSPTMREVLSLGFVICHFLETGLCLQDECYNYIKVLVPRNDETLFACGTNAFNPTCRNYKVHSLLFLSLSGLQFHRRKKRTVLQMALHNAYFYAFTRSYLFISENGTLLKGLVGDCNSMHNSLSKLTSGKLLV